MSNRDTPSLPNTVSKKVFSREKFKEKKFGRTDYQDCDFSQTCFEQCSFDGVFFNQCHLENARFIDCTMHQCSFYNSSATAMTMERCELRDINSVECDFQNLLVLQSRIEYWSNSTTALHGLRCLNCHITYWTTHEMPEGKLIFSGGKLHDPVWFDCHLVDSRFEEIDIERQVMGNSKLQNCSYHEVSGQLLTWQRCTLENCSFPPLSRHKIFGNLRFHQSTLLGCDFDACPLSGALFAETLVKACQFKNSQLAGAVFDDARLEACRFDGAQAKESSWRRAQLQNCSGIEMDLAGSHWQYAALDACDFRGSSLRHAQLHGMTGAHKFDEACLSHPVLCEIDAWHQRVQAGRSGGNNQPSLSGGRHYV